MNRRMILWVALSALLWPGSGFAGTDAKLNAFHRAGQTFVTFEEPATGVNRIYRHTAPVTVGNMGSLTPVATLAAGSGKLLYDDSAGQNLHSGFIVQHRGPHLAAGTGLYVHTTAANGRYYYAFVNANDGVLHAMADGIDETAQAVPGAVVLAVDNRSGRTYLHCYAWEDYATWDHGAWGYYGHRFSVLLPAKGSGPHPVLVTLHAAGGNGYHEAAPPGNGTEQFIVIAPNDLAFLHGMKDPYTGGGYFHSMWSGRFKASTGLYMTCTEDRVVRYAKLVRENAISDGTKFEADPNRIYVTGGSLGSCGMHVVAHHPEFFAAAVAQVGFVKIGTFSYAPGLNDGTVRVNTPKGETVAQYSDLGYQAAHRELRPIIHTPNQDDGVTHAQYYPAVLLALEANHQAYAVEWQSGNHANSFRMARNYPSWDLTRFLLNEAYPAFSNATSSDMPEAVAKWGNKSTDTNGQRNGKLDWHSALHKIPGASAIADTASTFAISLRTTTGDATVAVTPRNAQAFHPAAGQTVTWATSDGQSGAATRNGDGSYTVTDLKLTTTTVRLTLTVVGGQQPLRSER